jgi:DNA polymerase I-like protein with 3'-5' exonuclease and polymerase domains
VYFGSVCEVDSEGTPKPQRFNNVWSLVVYLNTKLDEGYSFVMHNAKFDWLALRVRGFAAPIERVYCTQVLAYLLDNQRDSYSLDSLTGEKEDLIANLVEEGFIGKKISKSDFWNIDHSNNEPLLERLKDYCDSDVRATYHLYKKLCAVLNVESKASVRSAYFCIDQPMIECLCDLEQSGIQIDEELLLDSICTFLVEKHKLVSIINERFSLMPKLVWDAKADEFVPDVKTFAGGAYKNSLHVPPYYTDNHGVYMRSWQGHKLDSLPLVVYDHCPLIPFNPAAATGHTYWAIKEKCPSALELLEKTPTGKPKVNKEFVEDIADVLPEDLPIGRLAVVNKKLTMCLTFEKHLQLDGRLHPEFAHTRTLTGRLATSNP